WPSAFRATIGAPKPKRLIDSATSSTAASLTRGFSAHGRKRASGHQTAAARSPSVGTVSRVSTFFITCPLRRPLFPVDIRYPTPPLFHRSTVCHGYCIETVIDD